MGIVVCLAILNACMLAMGSRSVEPACRNRGSVPEIAKLFLETQRLIAAETDVKMMDMKDQIVQLRKDLMSAKLDSDSKMVALKGQISHLKMMHGQEIVNLKNSSQCALSGLKSANAAVLSLKAELLAVRADLKSNLNKTESEIDLIRNQTAENTKNLQETASDVHALKESATNTTGSELEDRTVQIENRVLSLENEQSYVNSSISVIQEDQTEMTNGLKNLKNKMTNSFDEIRRNITEIKKTQCAASCADVTKNLKDLKKRVDAIESNVIPTATPSAAPSATPSAAPSATPSATPSAAPSATPSAAPSATPSAAPSATPSATPSTTPSATPSTTPTATKYMILSSHKEQCPANREVSLEECRSNEMLAFIRAITPIHSWLDGDDIRFWGSWSSLYRNPACIVDYRGGLVFNTNKSGREKSTAHRSICKTG